MIKVPRKVQERIPILYVVDVAANTLAEIRVATETVDSRPPGHAGDNVVTGIVINNFLTKLFYQFRSLGPRSDEA